MCVCVRVCACVCVRLRACACVFEHVAKRSCCNYFLKAMHKFPKHFGKLEVSRSRGCGLIPHSISVSCRGASCLCVCVSQSHHGLSAQSWKVKTMWAPGPGSINWVVLQVVHKFAEDLRRLQSFKRKGMWVNFWFNVGLLTASLKLIQNQRKI